jgi:hypothetical protein
MFGSPVRLHGTAGRKYGEVEPLAPLLEHSTCPSKWSLAALKETEAGWVSLPSNERKSVMPKAVAKHSSSARGNNEGELVGVKVGKANKRGKRRLKATALVVT